MGAAVQSNNKLVIIKETTFNVAPANGASAEIIARTGSSMNSTRDYSESQNIRSDKQASQGDFGIEKISGSINGELSGKRHSLLYEGVLGGTFSTKYTSTAGAVSIAAPVNGVSAVTSPAITGMKVGDVIKFTGQSVTAFNGVNFMVTAVTSTTAFSIISLNPNVTLAVSSAASGTVAYVGKEIELNPAVSKSFTIEDGYTDIGKFGVYTGCKIQSFELSGSSNSLVTNTFNIVGTKLAAVGNATAYSSAVDNGYLAKSYASSFGVLRLNGTVVGGITSSSVSVNRELAPSEYMFNFARLSDEIFEGKYSITGKITAALFDKSLFDLYSAENPVDVILFYQGGSLANAEFIKIYLPAVVLKAPSINTNSNAIVQDIEFTAILKSGMSSTIYLQDSLA